MKCIIFGGREFNNYEYLCDIMDSIHPHYYKISHVISGKARGADTLGERWAKARGIPIIECPANWELHGKRAGWIRNNEMADIADLGVGFNGGTGTQMMFDILTKRKIIFYDARHPI